MSNVKSRKPLPPRAVRQKAVATDGIKRRTISFYRYVSVAAPLDFRVRLLAAWEPLGCLGRIYVATEGINAQMSVPAAHFPAFEASVASFPELAGVPFKVAVEEGNTPAFYALKIKVRPKIVADGITDPTFDPSNTGDYLTPAEINAYVDDPDAVLVDMRNAYESEVGHFATAICPAVDTFREELAVLPQQLAPHKHKKIALYCTGGIRCEKASAWLKHQGFTNVRHLKGGIIDYAHAVAREGLPNKFRGKNFVFDERLGERVSDDIVSTCHICKHTPCDTHWHCAWQPCHALFIGCESCTQALSHHCSRYCSFAARLPEWLAVWLSPRRIMALQSHRWWRKWRVRG